MRRIAVINQKGGVGKTTTSLNLGAALARAGRRVVLVDMDAQANLTLSLNAEAPPGSPSTYTLLLGESTFEASIRPTASANLRLLPANIDLSGAELELAAAMGREFLMKEALVEWERDARAKKKGRAPADYVIFDCPPSLGLLSINALAAAEEVLVTIQTEFLALQGMSKLFEILQLLKKRLNPRLEILGILPCLYDSRLKLAREVLAEIRKYFGSQVLASPVRSNVKLAEAPSFGKTIFEYAPDSKGALDYVEVAKEIASKESRDPELAKLAPIGPAPAAEKLETVVLVPAAPPATPVAPGTKAPPAATVATQPAATTDQPRAASPKRVSPPPRAKKTAPPPPAVTSPPAITPPIPAPTAIAPEAPAKPATTRRAKAPTTPAAPANAKGANGNSFEVLESYVRPA
jgi:chromosome partitioning protein